MIRVDSTATDPFDTGRFEAGRNRLTSSAYRLSGSATDAEDAVQDAFLHWQAADRQRIKVPQAWLTKVVTNLCLDRLRSAHARRERTAGAWLPDPLLDGDPALGPADTVEQREPVTPLLCGRCPSRDTGAPGLRRGGPSPPFRGNDRAVRVARRPRVDT